MKLNLLFSFASTRDIEFRHQLAEQPPEGSDRLDEVESELDDGEQRARRKVGKLAHAERSGSAGKQHLAPRTATMPQGLARGTPDGHPSSGVESEGYR